MRIEDLTLTLFAWDGIPATQYGHSGSFAGSSELGLLTIRTGDGLEGHAFLGSANSGAANDARSLIHHLKPAVVGRHPLDRERIFQDVWQRARHTTLRAIGAVDVALWDIAGKIAGLPVHRLIGTCRGSAPAYASSAVLEAPEAYAEEAQRFKAARWAAYKIHPPADWQAAIRICEAVRRAVGDDYRLMLDATWRYRYEEAIRVGRAIEALGFHWYEDPLPADDIYGYMRLKEHLDIPLMATERSPGGLSGYQPWIVNRATDYLRGDVAVKGGLTTCLKTAHLAEAFCMNYEIHHGGNSLNNFAGLNLLMAIPNTELFEVLLPSAAQKYGLVDDIEPDADGMVHAPTAPGLGATIDFDLIRRKTTAVLR